MTHKGISLIVIFLIAGLAVAYIFCLPKDLFAGTEYSTVVTDRNGELLGARIAKDGQWRFPECDTVPPKFQTAIIEFEDKWFALHRGMNPVSIVRAAIGNVKAGRVTSGGSTITMQVVRMLRRKERTLRQKMIEAVLATRLELRYSKERILALYASHAPFGGNVVGIEAAAWRYYGKPADELSWGETATLAVLPNSPADIYPGRNRESLLNKRNRLLHKMFKDGCIDSTDLELALEEPLPAAPEALPQEAYHLVEYYRKTNPGEKSRTSIDIHLQRQVQAITNQWNEEFSRIGIYDIAAVVVDVHTGEVLAYVGNANPHRKRPGADVDIARSPRSTGSILKPFLYCAMLQEGELLPKTLLPDIPINLGGFSPQNFNRQFDGAVPASEALARSLNVPAVYMLKKFGTQRFLEFLRRCGMTSLGKSADHYGLSLILGGGECTLLDVTKAYSRISLSYQAADTIFNDRKSPLHNFPLKDKCAIWYTLDALKEVNRPDEIDWRLISSVKRVAWKTGTSYGFRDAWAVGLTPEYAVGVWVGNAEGQGVPVLVGARTAGPVMFDIFNMLPSKEHNDKYASNGWFLEPVYGDYIKAEVCPLSGHLAGPGCDLANLIMLPRKAMKSDPCPYHKIVDGIKTFILPPSMEWYYRQNHPEYAPYSPEDSENYALMEFIYPEGGSTIYIPRQLDGSIAGITFNLAHRLPSAKIFWHLDNEYVGQTQFIHQLSLTPAPGRHTVTVVDDKGNSLSVSFTIAVSEKSSTRN
ncbi:MAG: penicillin-binding protein 1C [Bacteroidales bacterium]|nr:penicillin-binding protein 1C [Bacteroidales bacterium]MDY6001654.1 penicillin-binding protein 1C [Candidatus Cryptobacteroides sp.]